MASPEAPDLLTVPELAAELAAPHWAVRKTVDDAGLVAKRAGRVRIIRRQDIPALVREMRARRYIGSSEPAGAA